jgi:hypothetical protein
MSCCQEPENAKLSLAIELLFSEQKEQSHYSKVVYYGRKYSLILSQVAVFLRAFQLFVRTMTQDPFFCTQKTSAVIAVMVDAQRNA